MNLARIQHGAIFGAKNRAVAEVFSGSIADNFDAVVEVRLQGIEGRSIFISAEAAAELSGLLILAAHRIKRARAPLDDIPDLDQRIGPADVLSGV